MREAPETTKTPIKSGSTYIDMLLREHKTKLSPENIEFLNQLKKYLDVSHCLTARSKINLAY